MTHLSHAEKLRRCHLVDCRPPAEPAPAPPIARRAQTIDYLAKDYDSFLRALLDQIPSRLPGWKERTEADLGMALLELFAYLGDELSYYQDRVAEEAFLPTATQYESVRKLLRLIDYRLDPGRAARAVLTFRVSAARFLPAGFAVRTAVVAAAGGAHPREGRREPVVFETGESRLLHPELNAVLLASPAPADTEHLQAVLSGEFDQAFLPAGSWLFFPAAAGGEWARTAGEPVVDSTLHETTVTFTAPLAGSYPAGTALRGNGVAATHGLSRRQTATGSGKAGQTVALRFAPLTFTDDGAGKPVSSLAVTVDGEPWSEVEDFLGSGSSDGHFRARRDNRGFVTVHFGDGSQGRAPGEAAAIEVRYRTGIGESGKVAAGTLTVPEERTSILAVDNPLAGSGAREPESMDDGRLLGPRHLWRQERAVTEEDYGEALLAGVRLGITTHRPLHARARFVPSGTWTTVVVSVDLPGRVPLDQVPGLQAAFEALLATQKLAGYDVEVRDARYAPLYIRLLVHVRHHFFARQVQKAVEKALAPRRHADGTLGFFAPERFDFGQDVYLSDLYAAVTAVEGVEAVAVQRFKRLGDRYPDREAAGFIPIGEHEIARCDSDPAAPGHGVLFIRTCGGKEG